MCKRFVWTVCLMLLISPAYAQGKKEIIRKGSGALTERVETQVGRQVAGQTLRKGTSQAAAAARNAGRSAAAKTSAKTHSISPRESVSPVHTPPARGFSGVPNQPIDLNTVAGLVRQYGESKAEQKNLATVGFEGGFGRSVLFAPVTQRNEITGKLEPGGFSVTVVEVNGEIFGVVATHVLSDDFFSAEFGLQQDFAVHILQPDGTPLTAQAHVVFPAPRSMLDITLVKFDPQIEPFLKPLQIATSPIEPNEILFSPGYANTAEVLPIRRPVERLSFLSVQTATINIPGGLKGFCGSPLLDAQGHVKAIHTGSGRYGTHAHFINKLVQAYHNDGKATYDLVLDGHVLTTLYVNEYISGFALLDNNFQVLFKDDGLGVKFDEEQWNKYSESKIRNTMKKYSPNAAYLVLHSRTPFWYEQDGVSFLAEDRTISGNADSNLRVHVYDIENQELLYSIDPEDVNTNNLYFDLDGMTIR